MRIALFNLPIDNNYGGNLQRYALVKVLQDLGHEVEHVQIKSNTHYSLTTPLRIIKRIFVRILNGDQEIFIENNREKRIKTILPFYNKYIPHTKKSYDNTSIKHLEDYDAYIVGSDQVWRKSMAKKNLDLFYLSFLQKTNSIKIAFSVSFGSDINELNKEEIVKLGKYYSKFSAVSVRELSGLKLIKSYGWITPNPVQLLDPSFLLSKKDYQFLIENGNTVKCDGNLFCYLLDPSSEKSEKVIEIAKDKCLTPFYITLKDNYSIEQWLRSFQDADYVITDSYHGLVFSIIFNKPFFLFRNKQRGNSRFDTLFSIFSINDSENINWEIINNKLIQKKQDSIGFLFTHLN